MRHELKNEIKLWIRRWTITRLRLLVDAIDDRLHAAEVRLREACAAKSSPAIPETAAPWARVAAAEKSAAGETFKQWELRRSGVAPIVKAKRGRRHVSAEEFSRRFA